MHPNRTNQRANWQNIINERSGETFGVLCTGGRKMKCKATGQDRSERADDATLARQDARSCRTE
jgi:hypothetical protein